MKNLTVFNAREIEILGLLGFDSDGIITVKGFLKTIVIKNRPSDLHNKGVALRSVRAMLRKISPDDKALEKVNRLKTFDDEEIEQLLSSYSI